MPWTDNNTVICVYDYMFDVYDSIEDMEKQTGWTTEEIRECFEAGTAADIGRKVVFFNECNYDYYLELPIGEFTKEEIEEIKQIQEPFREAFYDRDEEI